MQHRPYSGKYCEHVFVVIPWLMARRIEALDALRGVTAAAVVIGHAMGAADLPAPSVHWAVIIFFVLSGFVLALPWVGGRPPSLSSFLIRRVCRLWPPVAVSILLSALLFVLIGTKPPDLLTGWQQPLSGDLFVRCLLLTGQHGGCDALDIPLWSLVFETRISLVFPVLIAMTLHRRRLAFGFAIVCGTAIEVVALEARSAGKRTPHRGWFRHGRDADAALRHAFRLRHPARRASRSHRRPCGATYHMVRHCRMRGAVPAIRYRQRGRSGPADCCDNGLQDINEIGCSGGHCNGWAACPTAFT